MKRCLVLLVVMLVVMTSSALAQPSDAPAPPEVTPPPVGEPAPAPTLEPAPAPPAAPAPAPAAGRDVERQGLIGVEAMGVIPLAEYGDLAEFGLGGLVRVEYAVLPQLRLGARIGALFHVGALEGFNVTMIPILAGARYDFAPGGSGGFVFGELGANVWRLSLEGAGELSQTETQPAIQVGGGFTFDKIHGRLSLFIPDVNLIANDDNGEDTVNVIGIMATVGYDIAAF